jgi:sRNA-binding protein
MMTLPPQKKTLSIKIVPDHVQKLQMIKEQMIQQTKKEEENKPVPLYKKPAVAEAIEWLYITFPSAFLKKEQRPLKINILDDIFAYLEVQKEAENLPSKRSIKAAMATYVRNRFYLKACVDGAFRIDLDGKDTTQIIASEAEYALSLFEKFDGVFREKQKKLKAAQKRNRPPFDGKKPFKKPEQGFISKKPI